MIDGQVESLAGHSLVELTYVVVITRPNNRLGNLQICSLCQPEKLQAMSTTALGKRKARDEEISSNSVNSHG